MEIFRLLCIKAGANINQSQLAKLLKVSPTAIANALALLDKEGLVKIDKSREMTLNIVSLNRDSRKVMLLKRAENLGLIYENGLAEFLEDNFPGCTIILFGSYSRGDDTEKSDVDIAVIGSKQKDLDMSIFGKKLDREIIINFYPSFKDIKKDLKENLCNGIVLAGGIEL